MVRNFTRIKKSVEAKGNSAFRLDYAVERKGMRVKRFIIKRMHEPEQVLQRWATLHKRLRELKVPTSPSFELSISRMQSSLKQKDYSRGRKVPMMDAWRAVSIKPEIQRPFLGIVRDIAILHKDGLSLSPHEHLMAPGIFYRKPTGKIDRAIVDYGTIRQGGEVSAKENFERMLPLFKSLDAGLAEKALKTYFAINPNPKFKQMTFLFFGKKF